jgi:hypothetical protein
MTRAKLDTVKRRQRPKFKDLATTKQGTAGEAIAMQYFVSRGYIPYPVGIDGPHPVDFIVYNPASGKFIAVEVKTYPRLFSSEETGIDSADYKAYIELERKNKLEVWLLFVDVFEGGIYGAYLSHLRPGARLAKGKTYFPLARFLRLHGLNPAEMETLEPIPHPAKYRFVRRVFNF